MEKGNIILINGVSSSGKSTIVQELLDKLEDLYFVLSVDAFCDMLPNKFIGQNEKEALYEALSIYYKTIRFFSDQGRNVVVDTIVQDWFERGSLSDLTDLLKEYPVYLVKVTCPVHELQRREKERGDRRIGQAEEQIPRLVPKSGYDIRVDSFENSPSECADKIASGFRAASEYDAFVRLDI